MKAFVTGATGFLGSHLADLLLEKGWLVKALARKSSNLRWLEGKGVEFVWGDVGDQKGLEEGLKDVDVCFHLAGVIRAIHRADYFRVNAEGTRNLLAAAVRVNPKISRIVVVTSLAAAGPSSNEHSLTEEDPCRPVTDYGSSKLEAETIAREFGKKLPVTIIRPPGIYGPRDTQILYYFRMARWGFILLPWGSGRRLNLAHVKDVASGILLAGERAEAVGETFFIGDKADYEWTEIAGHIARGVRGDRVLKIQVPKMLGYLVGGAGELLTKVTGRSCPVNLANIRNFVQKSWIFKIDKARRVLGYEPTVSMAEGIRETAAWYRDNRWL